MLPFTLRFVTLIFLISSGIGFVAYRNYKTSEQHLSKTLADLKLKGKDLSPEQCVDEIVTWAAHCEAMKSLCDASTPRLMLGCLGAQNRVQYCKSLGDQIDDRHFGMSECRARNVTRITKKACGNAYSAIAYFCPHEIEVNGG